MYLFLMGVPGRFAAWCDAVALRLNERLHGATAVIPADTLEELALGAMEAGASQAVVSSRQPVGALRRALVESGRRFVVALEDPRMALLDLVLGQGVALPDAVQAVASSCAALEGFAAAPGALLLHSGHHWPQPVQTVADIARHFSFATSEVALAEIAAGLAGIGPPVPPDATAWWNGLDAAEQELTMGALGAYVDRHDIAEPLSLTWTHRLFFRGDQPSERLGDAVDITGRAHCVAQGPHIIVPPGSWSLSLRLGFSREAAEHAFSVEVWTDRRLAAGTIHTQYEGSAVLDLDFAIDDAAEHPVAIRISSTRAAFDGMMVVEAVTLTRTAMPPVAAAPDG